MDAVTLFRSQVAAFNAHDLDAFVATYHEDTVVLSTLRDPIVGRAELRAHYAARFEDTTLRCDVDRAADLGGGWVEAWERVSSAGQERSVRALFQVVDGTILRAALFPG